MRIPAFLSIAFLVGVCGLTMVWAQEKTAPANSKDNAKHLEKATAIKGMYVKNNKGEDLGRIEDLAITSRGGQILYVVLDFGGTLGFGHKHLAVPMSALKREVSKDRTHLVMDIAKDDLDKMPGFNTNDWPTAPDDHFTKGTSNLETKRDRAHFRRSYYLIGMAANNPKAESLGTVRDLMINCKEEKVVYAVVGRSTGVLSAEKYYAVPWQAIDIRPLTGRAADECFVIDFARTALESNAGFDRDHWPTRGDSELFRPIATK